MRFIQAAMAFVVLGFLAGCGGDQPRSPEAFYVDVERQWCQRPSANDMMSKFYYPDASTNQYVNFLARAVASPSREMEQECNNWNASEKREETRSRQVSPGRYAILGRTTDGSFSVIPHIWVIDTGDGYRIKFEPQ